MIKYEARLIDPPAEQVVGEVAAAAAGANKRCRARKLADDPAKWRKFARAVAGSAEGWEMWRGGRGGSPASQVLGAWWTDHLGRKHVVLRGRRVEDYQAVPLLHRENLEQRSPLWHAYPEYVYRRHAGGKDEWVCACGCGAVGTPEALAWMGDCCGPCFDRREEHGPGALRGNLPGVLHGDRDPIGVVAASPDGRWVAAREGTSQGTVHVWPLPTGVRRTWPVEAGWVSDLAFTRDGRYLLVVGFGYPDGLFAAIDPAELPSQVTNAAGPGGHQVIPLRDPGLALLHAAAHYNQAPPTRAELVRVPSGVSTGRGYPLPPDVATGTFTADLIRRLAVSPDDRLVATVGTERVLVLELGTWRRVADLRTPADVLAFTPDGSRLIVGANPGEVSAFAVGTWERLAFGSLPAHRPGRRIGRHRLTGLVVAPDGSAVCAADETGRVAAFDADSLALRAWFEWHIGWVGGLAVAGDTLFTAGGDGVVKVWPLRQLMQGV